MPRLNLKKNYLLSSTADHILKAKITLGLFLFASTTENKI